MYANSLIIVCFNTAYDVRVDSLRSNHKTVPYRSLSTKINFWISDNAKLFGKPLNLLNHFNILSENFPVKDVIRVSKSVKEIVWLDAMCMQVGVFGVGGCSLTSKCVEGVYKIIADGRFTVDLELEVIFGLFTSSISASEPACEAIDV